MKQLIDAVDRSSCTFFIPPTKTRDWFLVRFRADDSRPPAPHARHRSTAHRGRICRPPLPSRATFRARVHRGPPPSLFPPPHLRHGSQEQEEGRQEGPLGRACARDPPPSPLLPSPPPTRRGARASDVSPFPAIIGPPFSPPTTASRPRGNAESGAASPRGRRARRPSSRLARGGQFPRRGGPASARAGPRDRPPTRRTRSSYLADRRRRRTDSSAHLRSHRFSAAK